MHVKFILPALPVPNGSAADAGCCLVLGTFDSYVESIYYFDKALWQRVHLVTWLSIYHGNFKLLWHKERSCKTAKLPCSFQFMHLLPDTHDTIFLLYKMSSGNTL